MHAGGKIEALGTGIWAAPRGTAGAGAAGETVEASSGTGMMTVETVCAVDVRDNTQPVNSLFADVTASPRAALPAATASLTSGGATLTATQAPGGKKDKKTEERERKEAEKTAKLAEKEARRLQVCTHSHTRCVVPSPWLNGVCAVQQVERERRKNEEMEAKWKGRAGGLDVSLPAGRARSVPSGEDAGALPPLSSTKSATALAPASATLKRK